MLATTKEEDEQMVDEIMQDEELASNDDDIQVGAVICVDILITQIALASCEHYNILCQCEICAVTCG